MGREEKRRFGDRRDGKLLRDLDSMHIFTPLLYPNRCDNEAYISEVIDLTAVDEYLAEKKDQDPDYAYNLFQVIVTVILKVLTQRPKLNRFICNKNTYQRNEITASFVVKKIFSDTGEEGLAKIKASPEDTIDSIHNKIYRQVSTCRSSEDKDTSSEAMDMVGKFPRPLVKIAVAFIRFLDRHGWVPNSLVGTDPYYCSAVLTNLGSIHLHAGYHHLTNWGTNSLVVVIGERKMRPFYNDDGSFEMRNSVDLGLTIDERLADGYYYSRTIKLLKKLMEEPELLEKPLKEEVEY